MNKQIFNLSIGVQALIFSKNKSKILLVKRSDFPVWTLPGGRVENKESLPDALPRELKEEIGINVINPKFLKKYKVSYFPLAGLTYVFICNKFYGRRKINSEIVEAKFWPLACLPLLLLPYLKQRIKDGISKNVRT